MPPIPSVSRFMTRQPFTISSTASLDDAHRLMRQHKIRHLPVVADGRLVGIVSMGDLHLLETIADFPLDSVTVEEAMTENPFVATSDMPVDDVASIMADHKYGSAIVVGPDGIEGIFTAVDACRALAEVVGRAELDEILEHPPAH